MNIEFQRAKIFAFSFLQMDLASLSRFASMVDDFLETETNRRENEETLETNAHAVGEMRGKLVDTLLSSMTVAFYARLESFLFEMCRISHEKGACPKDPGFLKNIDAAKDYLKRVPSMRFPEESSEWVDIQNLRNLRNIIAHNNRILGEDDQRRESIESIPHVSIRRNNEVWLERGLLEHVSKTVSAFAASLNQSLRAR